MHSCRKYACNLVKDGFDLRLSIWSQASEREHMKNTIAHLDDQVFPPNFVMGLGRWPRWLQTKGDEYADRSTKLKLVGVDVASFGD